MLMNGDDRAGKEGGGQGSSMTRLEPWYFIFFLKSFFKFTDIYFLYITGSNTQKQLTGPTLTTNASRWGHFLHTK